MGIFLLIFIVSWITDDQLFCHGFELTRWLCGKDTCLPRRRLGYKSRRGRTFLFLALSNFHALPSQKMGMPFYWFQNKNSNLDTLLETSTFSICPPFPLIRIYPFCSWLVLAYLGISYQDCVEASLSCKGNSLKFPPFSLKRAFEQPLICSSCFVLKIILFMLWS